MRARPNSIPLSSSRKSTNLDPEMNTPRKLAITAIVLFLISHLLPAYGNESGFGCFNYCLQMLLGHEGNGRTGGWFYYSAFVIDNILFVALAAALFLTNSAWTFRSALLILSFLHVLSWFALHLIPNPSALPEIKIGYYLWLASYGLLLAAYVMRKQSSSLGALKQPAAAAPTV